MLGCTRETARDELSVLPLGHSRGQETFDPRDDVCDIGPSGLDRGGRCRARCVAQRVTVAYCEHDTYGPRGRGDDFNYDLDHDRDVDGNVVHDDEHGDRDHTDDEQLVEDDNHKHLITHDDANDTNVNDNHARHDRTSH